MKILSAWGTSGLLMFHKAESEGGRERGRARAGESGALSRLWPEEDEEEEGEPDPSIILRAGPPHGTIRTYSQYSVYD